MFVDKVNLKVKAGDGGNGAVSFRHEKYVDHGGPDGGDGGDGGNIVLRASENQNTLAKFRYNKLLVAEGGVAGSKRRKHGKRGNDLVVEVPVGTVVTIEGKEVADLVQSGQQFVLAKGGNGGFGNAHFASSTRQAPRVAEKGAPGEEFDAEFELKMIADVGLVGLPNAGKSTFLSKVSNAKPEVANYPFTTLNPNLGVVDTGGDSLLIADIPGLIEGASLGKGLGDEFLRHVERTAILLHLIDAYQENVASTYNIILKELSTYEVDLSKKPQIVALTKIEGLDEDIVNEKISELKKVVPKSTPIVAISAHSGAGVPSLLKALQKRATQIRQEAVTSVEKESIPVLTLKDNSSRWNVEKKRKSFVVTGTKIEAFAAKTDFSNPHGVERLRDIMKKMGIMHELERKGVEAGCLIVFGIPEIGSIEY